MVSGWSISIVDAYDCIEGGLRLTVTTRPLWGMGV